MMPGVFAARTMSNRLVRWFTYNLGFALLPLCSGLLLRALADTRTRDLSPLSSELLFFSLMVSATALGDLIFYFSLSFANLRMSLLYSRDAQ